MDKFIFDLQRFVDIRNYESNTLLRGTDDNDYIYNDGSNVTIDAGAGNDSIGNDGSFVTIDGGSGNDYIFNGLGYNNFSIDGGAGNDSIYSNDGSQDTIDGGEGDDYINNSGGSNMTIDAGAGNDSIDNYGSFVTINGGDGNDYISAEGENVSILGGDGNDVIDNRGSTMTIDGDDGDDFIENTGSHVTIKGGAGDDYIYLESVDEGGNTIYGGAGADIFVYKGNANYWSTTSNDVLRDYEEEDTLRFNSAIDGISTNDSGSVIFRFGGNKLVVKNAADKLITYFDADDVKHTYGQPKALTLTDDDDVYSNSISGASISALGGNDSITNTADNVVFIYGGGNDSISGFNDSSTLKITEGIYSTEESGESGEDILVKVGENGSILLVGAASLASVNIDGISINDTLQTITNDNPSPVTVSPVAEVIDASARTKKIKITANDLNNSIVGGKSRDTIYGGAGSDSIYGERGNDKLYGDKGNDYMDGGAGNDQLLGGSGKDTLTGGDGNDTLWGGAGNDTLTGGAGSDVFVYRDGYDNDTILDYAEEDLIKITGGTISKISTTSAGSVVFTVGSKKLTLKNAADKIITYEDADGVKNFYPIKFNSKGTSATLLSAYGKSDFNFAPFDGLKNLNASKVTHGLNITGNDLNDMIFGGEGNDTLWGGAGDDTLLGGEGDDVFIYKPNEGTDYITDYEAGDMLKILRADGSNGGMFTSSSFSDGNLTLKILGGGSVVFSGVSNGDTFNINGMSYSIKGSKLK